MLGRSHMVSGAAAGLAMGDVAHTSPVICVAADDHLWHAFGAACDAAGRDRSEMTRQFWRWYARLPGARLPKRPPAAP